MAMLNNHMVSCVVYLSVLISCLFFYRYIPPKKTKLVLDLLMNWGPKNRGILCWIDGINPQIVIYS